jgi:hypothetical protein
MSNRTLLELAAATTPDWPATVLWKRTNPGHARRDRQRRASPIAQCRHRARDRRRSRSNPGR